MHIIFACVHYFVISLYIYINIQTHGANKLWNLLHSDLPYVPALGAITGNQAMQMVRCGLPAIYLSGNHLILQYNLIPSKC